MICVYVCYVNAGSCFLDFDEMMKTDDFLVLQKYFGSLGFVQKLEYLSRARDIKGYVLLCEAIL